MAWRTSLGCDLVADRESKRRQQSINNDWGRRGCNVQLKTIGGELKPMSIYISYSEPWNCFLFNIARVKWKPVSERSWQKWRVDTGRKKTWWKCQERSAAGLHLVWARMKMLPIEWWWLGFTACQSYLCPLSHFCPFHLAHSYPRVPILVSTPLPVQLWPEPNFRARPILGRFGQEHLKQFVILHVPKNSNVKEGTFFVVILRF